MAGSRGLAQSVNVRLARHAKALGADPNLVLTRYALERFLYRLSRSPHADRFVLKGAVLLLAWFGETFRPTRDVDMLGYGDLADEALAATFREVCGVEVEPDGMVYLPGTLQTQTIRQEDEYGGRRVTIDARCGSARARVQIDVGIGDAVTPAPERLEYPTLLNFPPPVLLSYTRESVIAEKVHALVLLGVRNSRMKDYFDLRALLGEAADAGAAERVAAALVATFARRRTELPTATPAGLEDQFAADATKQAQWRAFLGRNRLAAPTLPEVVAALREQLEVPLRLAHERSAGT